MQKNLKGILQPKLKGPLVYAVKWLQAESVIYDHYRTEMYQY